MIKFSVGTDKVWRKQDAEFVITDNLAVCGNDKELN